MCLLHEPDGSRDLPSHSLSHQRETAFNVVYRQLATSTAYLDKEYEIMSHFGTIGSTCSKWHNKIGKRNI